MRKLRLGEVNTNDLGDERCSQKQTRVCGTPSLFDCILLPPWIVASWWRVERVSTIYSKTGSLISVFYGQAFGRSLGMRKSRRTSFWKIFGDEEKQAIAHSWGKHLYSCRVFAQEQSEKSTKPQVLSNSGLLFWPRGGRALLCGASDPGRLAHHLLAVHP